MVEMHHRNRCLWRNASNFAPEIFIEHKVAHNDHVAARSPSQDRFCLRYSEHDSLSFPRGLRRLPRDNPFAIPTYDVPCDNMAFLEARRCSGRHRPTYIDDGRERAAETARESDSEHPSLAASV